MKGKEVPAQYWIWYIGFGCGLWVSFGRGLHLEGRGICHAGQGG